MTDGINDNLLKWKGIEATKELALSNNAKVVIIGAGKEGLRSATATATADKSLRVGLAMGGCTVLLCLRRGKYFQKTDQTHLKSESRKE